MRVSLLLASLLLGCGDDLPGMIWSGDLVDFASDPEHAERLCAGTGPRLDASAKAISARLGITDPHRISYYWLPEIVDSYCGRPAGGCASATEIFATSPVMEHEVVHAYTPRVGRSDPFLEEGLAEYLGGRSNAPSQGDPTMLYGHPPRLFDPGFYPAAGRFVAALVALRSLPEVLVLYQASDYEDDADSFETKLDQHLQLRSEDVVASYRDEVRCPSLAYREKLVACTEEPIEFNAETTPDLTIDAMLDCDLEDVWGHDRRLTTERTLQVTKAARIAVEANVGTRLVLTACLPGCAFGDPIVVKGPASDEPQEELDSIETRLPEGHYALEITRTEPGPAQVKFHTF